MRHTRGLGRCDNGDGDRGCGNGGGGLGVLAMAWGYQEQLHSDTAISIAGRVGEFGFFCIGDVT